MNLRNFDPYLAIIITSYSITFGLYIYYGYQYDKRRGVMESYKKNIYTISLLSLIGIPYIGCLYSIIDNNLADNYIGFIVQNTILIIFFSIIILFKDTIINNFGYDSVIWTSEEDWLDKRKYDKQGKLIKGEKDLSPEQLEIRERAAKSEYTERIFMEQGISE